MAYTTYEETLSVRSAAPYDPDNPGLQPLGQYIGDTGAVAVTANATGTDSNEAQLAGFILLHEAAHAADYNYTQGLGLTYIDEVDTALNAWGYANVGTLSNDSTITSLWNTAKATGIAGYYAGTKSEWFAQALALLWSANVSGYNTTYWTNVRDASFASGGTASSLWSSFVSWADSHYLNGTTP